MGVFYLVCGFVSIFCFIGGVVMNGFVNMGLNRVFFGIVMYFIFGLWFNYNWYGVWGWDLFFYGDMFRDVLYLFKDWMWRVFNMI